MIEFPFIEHMWAFHTWPAEDEAAIDGGVEVFRYMEYAMTILADHPDRLIYFRVSNRESDVSIRIVIIWFCVGQNCSSAGASGRESVGG